MPNYPNPETWTHANPQQRQRASRSFDTLRIRAAPVFPGPLFIDDDNTVKLQSPNEVARRALILWAVALRADGAPQALALHLIEQANLWPKVSPKEKTYLRNPDPDPGETQSLVWRLESLWVAMWALGYIPQLDWPSGMCDVPHLAKLMRPLENDPAFISAARLRPTTEILDATDLIMRIHWAIRHIYLNLGGMIPEDLDWSGISSKIPTTHSPAVGVIEQRHYTLNWITNFLNPENWDVVDTPT